MTRKSKSLLAVGGCVLSIFLPGAMVFGYPGVMSQYWQHTYGVSQSAVSICLFFLLAALGFSMFVVGKLQEKLGARRMITIGSILCGATVFLAAYSTNIYMIYLWAFLNGASSSFIYTPALTTVQKWFPEKKGLVSGLVNFSFGISAAIMSPVFGHLLKTQGYVTLNYEMAVLIIIVGVIAAQLTEVPERVKFSSDENISRIGVNAQPNDHSCTVAESLRTKGFWFLWLTWAFQGAAGISMVTLSISFGLSKGFSLTSAVLILTSFNLANGLSRIIAGFVSDILGRNKTMSMTFLLAGMAYFPLPFANSLGIMCILAAVIGFAMGTLFVCSAPLVSDCFGMKHFGAIFGLLYTGYGFVAGVLGPVLGGYFIDRANGNFLPTFVYLGILCLISSGLIIGVSPARKETEQYAVSCCNNP